MASTASATLSARTLPVANITPKSKPTTAPPPSSSLPPSHQVSFPVHAAQLALRDSTRWSVGQTVYLVTATYLHDWLQWAWNTQTHHESLQRLAYHWNLPIALWNNQDEVSCPGPGPIDVFDLSKSEQEPLQLHPEVVLHETANHNHAHGQTPKNLRSADPLRRVVRSDVVIGASKEEEKKFEESSSLADAHPTEPPNRKAIAVPSSFYEALRQVHGVLAADGCTVTYQPSHEVGSPCLLLCGARTSASDTTTTTPTTLAFSNSAPLEFRRKIIWGPKPTKSTPLPSFTVMEKLMWENDQHQKQPMVELNPPCLYYRRSEPNDNDDDHPDDEYDGSTISSANSSDAAAPAHDNAHHRNHHYHQYTAAPKQGWVLMSAGTPLREALGALVQYAAPHVSHHSLRVWSHRSYDWPEGTPNRSPLAHSLDDGYEWVGLLSSPSAAASTSGASTNSGAGDKEQRTLADLDSQHILLETRRTVNAPWPRTVLPERLQVGDFCDAQDIAGHWYEALVQEIIDESTIRVHYLGWHSKWDGVVPRENLESSWSHDNSHNSSGVIKKGPSPPAPLWTRTKRWREQLKVGDLVEVRDSSSWVDRPKWYQGVVVQVGAPTDAPRPIVGGADLERPDLLLLDRTQQVLVEVEQENTEKAGFPALTPPAPATDTVGDSTVSSSTVLVPQPPFRRWVNLYGEEICSFPTHLKRSDAVVQPATLQYDLGYGRDKPVEILKAGHHGMGFLRESLRGSPPAPGSVGLHNLGNSCYLNSILQCLNHIEPISQYFLKDQYSQDLNKRNPLGSGGQVAQAFASVLHKMWSGEYSALAPRMLKQTVASFAPQFDNSYQHDSQEFCQFLLDGLHEDLNRVKEKPYVEELEGFGRPDEESAIESWRKHLLRHDSIIVDYCQGMHRSHLTCPHCGRESIKFDVFSSISLPLVTFKDKLTTIRLEDCLEKFMEGEQLDDLNAWFCPSCRKHVCALKMIALWNVPDILILHLKRFTFDTCLTSGNMLRSKMDYTVEFPVDGLDLTKHVLGPIDPDAPPIYRLFGVSEHTGPTANSGHYTATVRNSIDHNWYRYNDSHVGRTSGEASVTGGAYVLFYQRTKGRSKWAGLERIMRERGVDPYGGLETDQEGFTKVQSKKKKS